MPACRKCGAEVVPPSTYCGMCGMKVTAADNKAAHQIFNAIYTHIPHPYIAARKEKRPTTVADRHARNGLVQRFNAFLAVKITSGVGTMWCAYLFALLALISLPDAVRGGRATTVAWIAQTFL